VRKVVKWAVKQNKKLLALTGIGPAQRILNAQADGNTASQLFAAGAPQMGAILQAIDTEDFSVFADACRLAGINDVDLIVRMWDATMGSLNAQAAKPCW
jgi:hypothetical protein